MDEPARPAPGSPSDAETAASRVGASEPSGGSGNAPTMFAPPEPPPFVERRATADGRRIRPPTPRVALLLFAAIVVAFVLYLARGALGPFIIGLLIIYLLHPLVEGVARVGLPRWAAVLAVYVVVVVVTLEFLSLTLRPLVEQVSAFVSDLPALAAALDQQLQRLSEFYRGLALPAQLRSAIDEWLASLVESGGGFDPGVLLPVVNVTAGVVTSLFGFLIVPVWAFYLLKDRRDLTARFDEAMPAEWRGDVWAVIRIVERVFGQWVRGQVFLGLTVGIATFVGLLVLSATIDPIFGRFALLLAIIAGLFELLPIIGPILAAIPAVLLAATAGPQAAIAALVLYTVVQQVENNLLVPKIQGDAVELHPSMVMLALIVGGSIAGLLGAILALPVTAAGKSVFRYLFGRLSAAPIVVAGAGASDVRAAAAAEPPGGPGAGPRAAGA